MNLPTDILGHKLSNAQTNEYISDFLPTILLFFKVCVKWEFDALIR